MRQLVKQIFFLLFSVSLLVVGGMPCRQASAAQKPSSLTMNTDLVLIKVKGKKKLNVRSVSPARASRAVYYQVANRKVATVSPKGMIRGKKVGVTTVRATSRKNKKLHVLIKVMVAKVVPKKVKMSSSLKMVIGEKKKLNAVVTPLKVSKKYKKGSWLSKNKTVASVSQKGKVTANSEGKTTVSFITLNGKKAVCQVRVQSATTGLDSSLEPSDSKFIRITPAPSVEPVQPEASAASAASLASATPAGIATASVTGKPAATAIAPGTETPAAEIPSMTETPAVEIPSVTETPVVEIPSVTETPVATGMAPETEKPMATAAASVTEKPMATAAASVTEKPATADPLVTKEPVATDPPVTETPAGTESALVTRAPAVTAVPVTKGPAAIEIPATKKPVAATTVPATETPVTTATAPVTTATAPVTTATSPVTTATSPVTTATSPVTTATAPVTTATSPVTTATAPVTTATSPVTTVTSSATETTVVLVTPSVTIGTIVAAMPPGTSSELSAPIHMAGQPFVVTVHGPAKLAVKVAPGLYRGYVRSKCAHSREQ